VITDRMWARLLSSTNQPSFLSAKDVIEDKREEEPPTQILDEEKDSDDNAVKKEVSHM
jgi:6-phosphofructokinase 1